MRYCASLCFGYSLLAVSLLACGSTESTPATGNSGVGGSTSPPSATGGESAGAPDPTPGQPASGSCADFNSLGNVYWGELHTHTTYSIDSYAAGNRNTPEDAYAFARGAEVPIADGGLLTEIDRPLDFMAVTDHSEFLGVTGRCVLDAESTRYCENYRDQGSVAQAAQLGLALAQLARENPTAPSLCSGARGDERCEAAAQDAWQRQQQAAEAANEPCAFTAFIGYEWTATTGGANLHRNVIFSSNVVPDVPLDYIDYPTPLAMWQALSNTCRAEEGCRALTIPHNSNSSYGLMWETADDPEAVPYMQRYQKLVEIFQHKGNSECLPGPVETDPTCDFEIVSGSFIPGEGAEPAAEEQARGYVRSGLSKGLTIASSGAANPLQMGILASTDTHNGTPGAVSESDYQGHMASQEDTAEERLRDNTRQFNPGGLVGVWAPENTREAIFDALDRRATFATSGPRIVVRLFAAIGLDDREAEALCRDPEFPAELVARGGVEMGSELVAATMPHLFIVAMKDDVDLEEIDVVRLAVSPSGSVTTNIRRFPLQGSDRAISCLSFRDEEPDAVGPSLYYARVFQEPTYRWSHYDCSVSAADGCESGGALDVEVRERAWSSPVFLRAP